MNYDEMLTRGVDKMPVVVRERDRFEIPPVRGHLQGKRTVLSNFAQIANILRREPEHLLKYILRELASPGELLRDRAIIGARIPAARINDKIRHYAITFVLCAACGKPDTDLVREGEFLILSCSACGSRNHVKSKI